MNDRTQLFQVDSFQTLGECGLLMISMQLLKTAGAADGLIIAVEAVSPAHLAQQGMALPPRQSTERKCAYTMILWARTRY